MCIFIFIRSPPNFFRLQHLYPRYRRCYFTQLTNWAFNWEDESQYTDYQLPLTYQSVSQESLAELNSNQSQINADEEDPAELEWLCDSVKASSKLEFK